MLSLPWRVIWRLTPKTFLTASAIGVVTAAALAGYMLGEILRIESISPEGPLANMENVASDAEGGTRFVLMGLRDRSNATVVVAYAEGPAALAVPAREAWVADPQGIDALLLEGLPGSLRIRTIEQDPYHAPRWFILDPAVARPLAARAVWSTEHVIAGNLAEGSDTVPGVGAFVLRSAGEIARDIGLVVVFACILTFLFAYEFIRSDVHDRREQLALLRALGLTRQALFVVVLARAAIALAIAVALGAAVAGALAGGIARFTPLTGAKLPGAATLILVCGAVLLAGLVGAAVPARGASRADIAATLEPDAA